MLAHAILPACFGISPRHFEGLHGPRPLRSPESRAAFFLPAAYCRGRVDDDDIAAELTLMLDMSFWPRYGSRLPFRQFICVAFRRADEVDGMLWALACDARHACVGASGRMPRADSSPPRMAV